MKRGNNIVYMYKNIEGVPNKLLDRILIETMSRECLDKLIKDNPNPKVKALKLKYKINPKQRLTDEQIIGIVLDYFEIGKGNELYTVIVKNVEERFDAMLDECFDETLDLEEDFLDNVAAMVECIDMPFLISYIRQGCDELHKYIPALLKTWIETEDFKRYEIDELYGFNYDKTIEEEFDVELYFECLDKDMITDKTKFECLLEGADNPIEMGIKVAMEHLEILKSYTNRRLVDIQDKTSIYEKLLSEKERELNDFKRQVKKLSDKVDSISKDKEESSYALEVVERRYEEIKEKLAVKEAKIEELKKDKRVLNTKSKAIQKELDDIKVKYDSLVESSKREVEEIKDVVSLGEEKIVELEESLLKLREERDALKDKYELLSQNFERMEEEYKSRIAEMEVKFNNENFALGSENEVAATLSKVDMGDDVLGDDFLGALSNEPIF